MKVKNQNLKFQHEIKQVFQNHVTDRDIEPVLSTKARKELIKVAPDTPLGESRRNAISNAANND